MKMATSLPFHTKVIRRPIRREDKKLGLAHHPFRGAVSLQSVISISYPNGLHALILAKVLLEILKGLYHIHAQDQLHGNLKPAYIFVGSNGSVKLANFGGFFANDSIDRSLIDLCTSIPYEQSLLELYTNLPYWIPPEFLNFNSRYNSQTDIWFFGLTALQLAHGTGTTSYEKKKDKIKNLSEDFKKLVASCLHQNPSERPTASALVNHPFFRQLDDTKGFIVKSSCQALYILTVRGSYKKRLAVIEGESTLDNTVNLNYHQRISGWRFDEQDLEFSPVWEEEGLIIKPQREESAYLHQFNAADHELQKLQIA